MANYDRERAERDYRVNPPKNAPGQSTGDEWDIDLDTSSSTTDESSFMGSDISVGSVLDSIDNGNKTQQQNNPSMEVPEWEALVQAFKVGKKGAKGVYAFVDAMITSFKNNSEGDWHRLGTRMIWVSLICGGIGFALLFMKILIPSIGQPQTLICGSIITFIVGIFLSDKFERDDECMEEEESYPQEPQQTLSYDDFNIQGSDFILEEEEESTENSTKEEDFNWDSLKDDFIVEDEIVEEEVELSGVGTEGFNIEDAINTINVEQPGIWTRQYLFENYCKVLPNVTPAYTKIEVIDNDMSDEFMMFSEYIRGAAIQFGIKEENIPELQEIRKNLFIIQLRATRPTVAKEQEIADAVADKYSRDEKDRVVKQGVYATVDSVIGVFIINIFTGNSAMVSLKDIYDKIPDFVKDVDIQIPFVWGISEMGEPYYCDLINCDSIIISGEGRGGKSWKGQSIVAQLSMYHSPKELEFYIFDNKNTNSDYRYPGTVLPHIKYFCGDVKKHNSGLKKLIEYTTNTTGKILTDNDCLNIKDYNKKHPNNKLPYRYVVIDEIMALMNAFDKDEQEEFRNLLSTIVSKLPYLGIRLVLFPHRIVDSVISKNAYSLVSTRAIVRQLNEEEIKSAVGVTRRQFPYKLTNFGDMAIRSKDIASGEVVFCHAEVLTRDNDDNKEIFRFIGSIWNKLCPECKCITIGKHDSVGGYIGEPVEERVKRNTSPVDHTVGKEEYKYDGYSVDETLNNIDKAFDGLNEEDDSESFWDSVLNNK